MTEIDESKTLKPTKGERKEKFRNLSNIEIKKLYMPDHIQDLNYVMDLGEPGQYPFTRGAYKNMYRGRLWTMRQFAGFGNAEQTNQRYKFLLEHGQTGLSVAFSLHTIYGIEAVIIENFTEIFFTLSIEFAHNFRSTNCYKMSISLISYRSCQQCFPSARRSMK